MRTARIARMAAVAAVVATLAGCSSEEPAGPAALTAEQTTAEYRAEAADLKLAPGWSWPEEPIEAKAADGLGIVYEPGFGKQAADSHWFCSWADRVLDGSVPPAQREQAKKELPKIRDLNYYTDALAPESRPFFDNILESTELGDLGPLRTEFELNCPKDSAS